MRNLVFFLLALPLAPAWAIEPYTCRNGLFPRYEGKIESSVVVAKEKERVNFRSDEAECPDKASCIQKTYLVNGDTLLVSEKHKNWVCAWYFGKKREFVGWLPAKNVKTATPEKTPTPEDWIGVWKPIAGENQIRIRAAKKKGALAVDGDATWMGGETSPGERVIHVGQFEGTASPAGTRLTIGNAAEKYECVVKMQWVSGALVVSDNNFCGGMNVSFGDVYRKQ